MEREGRVRTAAAAAGLEELVYRVHRPAPDDPLARQPKSPSRKSPRKTWESPGAPVTPASLYLAQLSERLGTAALKNIGY
jgi:hypothetical protein